MLNYFPRYFTNKAILLYLAGLLAVSLIFFNYTMSWYWYLFGLAEVIGFFYFSNRLSGKWQKYSDKRFVKDAFLFALLIRVMWVLFSYYFYIYMTGVPFEFDAADVGFYHEMGLYGKELILSGNFHFLSEYEKYAGELGVSDSGYAIYLSFIYFLTGNSIIVTRLLKALIGAYTVILIYRLAKRNFGEETGRLAAVFAMLMPNLIYYTGLHLKEIEMVFLIVAFLERADYAMRSPKFTLSNLILPILIAISLFFLRTVLGAAALFAFITALVFSNLHTFKKGGRRIVLTLWVGLVIVFLLGGRIATEVEEVWADRFESQETSMTWRAEREGGNQFAKYASGVVFAPMIAVIPFPTMVDTPGQENQKLIHGGNYVKNIMAYFAMFATFMLFIQKRWRDNLLILAYTVGYLIIVAMSPFAHSERFHQPVIPFLMILAAVGISLQSNKTKNLYKWYLVGIFVAMIGWSWFKLAGRGLV